MSFWPGHFSDSLACNQVGRLQPGDSVIILGVGPVGLMAAMSAGIKGASKVIVVNHQPDHDHNGHEVPNVTMNNLVKSQWATGGIGVVGVAAVKAKSSMIISNEVKLTRHSTHTGILMIALMAGPECSNPQHNHSQGPQRKRAGLFLICGRL